MMKKVAILQSNYIPWKGYFDLINSVDEFVLYDDVQYTRRDWRNRNKIKTRNGTKWLTIPVVVKGKFHQSIRETEIQDKSWAKEHLKAIEHEYAKAPHFREYKEWLLAVFSKVEGFEFLSEVNELFITEICQLLGIKTRIRQSNEFELAEERSQRLLSICSDLEAQTYVSGPAAKSYLNEEIFVNKNINVEWYDYKDYQKYNQFHPPFEHGVTVLDLIFHLGPEAPDYMNTFHSVEQRK